MTDATDTVGAVEGGISIVVLVVVLAVVLEVLATVPAVGIVESNPLGFVLDWMGELTDDDSNENSDSNGGLW
jgi:hypothetical protein